MRHRIPTETLGPAGEHMARAVETCVHCGFCLPTCPTYKVLGEEMDSPRGRIVLMKQALEGDIAVADAVPYVDRCLGCLACVTACPSGVEYGQLLVPFRSHAERHARSRTRQFARRALLTTLESPGLFRASVRAGQWARPASRLLPGRARAMLDLVPATIPRAEPLPEVMPARGERRARVALLAGCAQQVLAPEINHATLRVLSANGVEVVIPGSQACCGALALHAGEEERARTRASALIRAMPRDVDAVVTNAAGCGSAMREYGMVLAGTALEADAHEFSQRVRDVSELLDDIGLVETPTLPAPVTVAYHDACHLAHAQKVRAAPRRLLGKVPGVDVREVPDADICCGSAGIYNIEHPDVARQLGAAKATAILSTGAQAVVSGNVGCLVQIASHLQHAGHPIPVLHTMQVLDGQPGI
jgi:glycolate oxidase iron-sulfur subunit